MTALENDPGKAQAIDETQWTMHQRRVRPADERLDDRPAAAGDPSRQVEMTEGDRRRHGRPVGAGSDEHTRTERPPDAYINSRHGGRRTPLTR